MAITSFKRIEKKYLLNEEQKNAVLKAFYEHMCLDKFCKNETTYKVRSIYFDTENQDLIRRSVEGPIYKEKLRARKYDGQKTVFLEIKKKSEGIVGKRRVELSDEELHNVIYKNEFPIREKFSDKQILNEIKYFLSLYKVKPNVFIYYDRLGFFDPNDSNFRITLDKNIRSSRIDFSWEDTKFDTDIIQKGEYVMEIKSVVNFPIWLVNCLSSNKIYPHSFSKYGTEYKLKKGLVL